MIGLLDCNNFYVSCERLFNRRLLNKPVVVLSNNDGCIISRSNEAKKLGIKMGEPFFKIRKKLKDQGVYVCSSNYSFYGDISQRVMSILIKECPSIQIYSIDEAFIDLEGIQEDEFFCSFLKEKIFRWTGIPVSIGIAKTKTLAKIANRVVKKNSEYKLDFKFKDVFKISSEKQVNYILSKTNIEDVWGIGRKLTRYFKEKGIESALDFKNISENFVRKEKGVLTARTVLELRGVKCYNIDNNEIIKKSICVSRSFGKKVTSYEDLKAALILYVQKASEKLRKNQLFCKSLTVFLQTSRYKKNYYVNSRNFIFIQETMDSRAIWIKSEYLLSKIYLDGLSYNKIGVILLDLCREHNIQNSLFNCSTKKENSANLMTAIDKINQRFGAGKIRISADKKGSFHEKKSKKEIKPAGWLMRSSYCSPCYTTRWCDIPEVTII